MYTALYRSFRPETFDALIGQAHIVKILKNQIQSGKTSHAYLFCGTRGTGKTSTARILAKGVNCLAEDQSRPCGVCANCKSIQSGLFMDVIEIDAASNNGVENVRELRESVKYPPSMGRCKVYIIDEVHMLSTGAFNALLKTLEEPPDHVMFILATTESQKLPATILSRCLRLDFHRIPEKELIASMARICSEIGVSVEESALALIAANADGSVRDGLSILDQCTSSGSKHITREDVIDILGTAGEEIFIEITQLIADNKTAEALVLIDQIMSGGKDVKQFLKDWIFHLRNLMMSKYVKNLDDVLNMSCENSERVRKQGMELPMEFISFGIMELSKTLGEAKWSSQPRTLLELAAVRLSSPTMNQSTEALLSRISALEKGQVPAFRTIQGQAAEQAQTPRGSVLKTEAAPQPEINKTSEIPPPEMNKPVEMALNEDSGGMGRPHPDADINHESLWHRIFEDAEVQKSSYNLIRSGTRLVGMDHKAFYLEATSGMAKEYAERNKLDLENLMEKHMGKRLQMDCRLVPDKSQVKERSASELAEEAGKRFGMTIEIIE
jgi:DNA polymerase-3 subunit gamma/tau